MKGYLQEACETRQAQATAGGEVVAVKKMIRQSRDQTIQFLREALNVCALNHSNVVRLKGIVMAGGCTLSRHAGFSFPHRSPCFKRFLHVHSVLVGLLASSSSCMYTVYSLVSLIPFSSASCMYTCSLLIGLLASSSSMCVHSVLIGLLASGSSCMYTVYSSVFCARST